jgi:hypothetical protein
MFDSVIAVQKALKNAGKKSSLEMYVIDARINFSISVPYDLFNARKQPTSRGWSRWDEWGGIQRVIMLFSLQ